MGDNITTNTGGSEAVSVTKTDAGQEATPSSLASTPEHDGEIIQDQAQPQKRKGGRKPVCLPIRKQCHKIRSPVNKATWPY